MAAATFKTLRAVLAMLLVSAGGLAGGATVAWAQTQNWQAGAGPQWQSILAAGAKEGKVVVAAQSAGAIGEPMAAAFERDTGIKLEFLGGGPELTARVAREAKAGAVTIDVVLGGGTELITLYSEKLLAPVKPQLMLPGVTDPKNWIGGKIKWMDNEGQYLLQAAEYVSGRPVVNSDIVEPKSIGTWKDLLKPEFKGRIASYDPRPGGAGQAIATYLAHVFGIKFITDIFVGQQVTYTRDGRQLVEWAARGTYPIVMGAIQADTESFRGQGIKTIVPLDLLDGPGFVTGGFSVLKQTKGVPHANAATVFINWFVSKPGQEVYSRFSLEPSRRVDATVETVPAYVVPKPGVMYLDSYTEEFYAKARPSIQKMVIEALGGR